MAGPLHLSPGELTVDEMMERLHDGTRILMEQEVAGTSHQITLRFDGTTYYCDTPTTLHRHTAEDDMRACLRNQGYGQD